MTKNGRVEQLQDYFKTHNKSKEQKAHTSKVNKFDVFFYMLTIAVSNLKYAF